MTTREEQFKRAEHVSVVPRRDHRGGYPCIDKGKGEVKRLMKELDCLKIAGASAIKKKLATRAQLNKVDKEVASFIDEAAQEALAAPGPELSELLTDVYSSEY